jgi:hypothetical protein
VRETGPPWLRESEVVRVVDDYLRSGVRFAYLHAALDPAVAGAPDDPDEERRRTTP